MLETPLFLPFLVVLVYFFFDWLKRRIDSQETILIEQLHSQSLISKYNLIQVMVENGWSEDQIAGALNAEEESGIF